MKAKAWNAAGFLCQDLWSDWGPFSDIREWSSRHWMRGLCSGPKVGQTRFRRGLGASRHSLGQETSQGKGRGHGWPRAASPQLLTLSLPLPLHPSPPPSPSVSLQTTVLTESSMKELVLFLLSLLVELTTHSYHFYSELGSSEEMNGNELTSIPVASSRKNTHTHIPFLLHTHGAQAPCIKVAE